MRLDRDVLTSCNSFKIWRRSDQRRMVDAWRGFKDHRRKPAGACERAAGGTAAASEPKIPEAVREGPKEPKAKCRVCVCAVSISFTEVSRKMTDWENLISRITQDLFEGC